MEQEALRKSQSSVWKRKEKSPSSNVSGERSLIPCSSFSVHAAEGDFGTGAARGVGAGARASVDASRVGAALGVHWEQPAVADQSTSTMFRKILTATAYKALRSLPGYLTGVSR
jgi:hypothetical protein